MTDDDPIAVLRAGADRWNSWRSNHAPRRVSLRNVSFEEVYDRLNALDFPEYFGFDFSRADLNCASLRNAVFHNCDFSGAKVTFADLCFSSFHNCNFNSASLRVSRLGSATFRDCDFTSADLAYCSAEQADFTGSRLVETGLEMTRLVRANFKESQLVGARVYGTAAWDLNLTGAEQRDLVLTRGASCLTVDDIEVAQFINLLVQNPRIRRVTDTIVRKVVLILGRFTPPRLSVLREVKRTLRASDYVPVMFDFEAPSSRDLTETVSTLAHLSRFVIADLTAPRSIPHELQAIVPHLPSVPVQPFLRTDERAYGMFEHLERYSWVLPPVEYTDDNVSMAARQAIASCEKWLDDQCGAND